VLDLFREYFESLLLELALFAELAVLGGDLFPEQVICQCMYNIVAMGTTIAITDATMATISFIWESTPFS